MSEQQNTGAPEPQPEFTDSNVQPIARGVQPLSIVLNVIAVFVVLFIGIMGSKAMIAMRKPPPKTTLPPPVLKVQVHEVRVGDERVTISGQGSVAAQSEIQIIPEATGKVLFAHPRFRDGGAIAGGEILYKIDPSTLEKERKRTLASIASLEEEIKYLKQRRDTLKSESEQALATLDISKAESDRMQRLLERGAASEAEVNQRLLTVQSTRERVEAYKSNIALIEPSIDKIQSQIAVTRAGLEQIDLNIARTVYRAPFTGRISGGRLETGQFVAAGQPLGKLQSADHYEIPVPLSMDDWNSLADGRTAESLESRPIPADVTWKDDKGGTHTCAGKAVRLGSQLDPRTRLVNLVVRVTPGDANCGAGLTPGLFTDVAFKGPWLHGMASIPRRALRPDSTVYVVQDGKFTIREVSVWRRVGEDVLIDRGLNDGDQVITSVVEEAIKGMPVAVISRNGKAVKTEPAPGGNPEETKPE